jgi:DNA-binding NarL/FixJ family response regulator
MPTDPTIDNHPSDNLLSEHAWEHIAEEFGLSAREVEVARLVFSGKSREEIANELGCSVGSVRTYIDRVFKKLQVEDRLAMALRIVRVHFEKR